MTTISTTPDEHAPGESLAFRDFRWKTRWLIVGLAVLLLVRCAGFLPKEWILPMPAWLWLILIVLPPHAFLLLFPLITRTRSPRTGAWRIPRIDHCLLEMALAIPVVMSTLTVVAIINYVISRLWPGSSLTPEAMKNMAESPNYVLVYSIMAMGVAMAPITEEVFFRGFLHNAFRVRMPWIVAVAVQCLIFGFIHNYGVLHSVAACFLGLVLTLLYAWRKTLVAPMFAHAGFNAVAFLGVALMMLQNANAAALGVVGDADDGVCLVRDVAGNSPAQRAGLKAGDVIERCDGVSIRDFPHLIEIMRRFHAGDTVTLRIRRGERLFNVDVQLMRRRDLSAPPVDKQEGR